MEQFHCTILESCSFLTDHRGSPYFVAIEVYFRKGDSEINQRKNCQSSYLETGCTKIFLNIVSLLQPWDFVKFACVSPMAANSFMVMKFVLTINDQKLDFPGG